MTSPSHKSMRLALALSLLVCCVGCDQTTKCIATRTLCGNPPLSCLFNTLRLEYALNPGGFLSVGVNLPPQLRFWIFAGLNVALLAGTVYFDCVLLLIGCKLFCKQSFRRMEPTERSWAWNGDMRCVMRN